MLQAVGDVVREARDAKGRDKKTAAKEMGINDGTLNLIESGRNTKPPTPRTQRAIELYYGWRPGSLTEVWDERRQIRHLSADMLLPTGLPTAAHLSDSDLIAELQFRLLMQGLHQE